MSTLKTEYRVGIRRSLDAPYCKRPGTHTTFDSANESAMKLFEQATGRVPCTDTDGVYWDDYFEVEVAVLTEYTEKS